MPAPEYIRRSYGGGAVVSQLTQTVGPTDTQFTISPVTGWVEEDGSPLGTAGPFTIAIDRFTPQVEKILARSIDLTSGLVTVFVDVDGWSGRGYDGTTPQSHVPGGSTSGVQNVWSSIEADEANQAVYDLLGAGGGSVAGVPIGGMIPFMGTSKTLPANFLLADGSAISRTTYSALFTAAIIASHGTTTAAGTTISGIPSADVALMGVGMQITGANLGSAGTVYTIATIASSTSITVTSGTGITAGTAGALVVYPWGAGDGSTTFSLPSPQGRAVVGSGAGYGLTNRHVGNFGGEETHQLTTGEIPGHNHGVTDPTHNHGNNGLDYVVGIASNQNDELTAVTPGTSGPTGVTFNGNTASASTGVSTTNTGGGGAHNNMQPWLALTYIVRAA